MQRFTFKITYAEPQKKEADEQGGTLTIEVTDDEGHAWSNYEITKSALSEHPFVDDLKGLAEVLTDVLIKRSAGSFKAQASGDTLRVSAEYKAGHLRVRVPLEFSLIQAEPEPRVRLLEKEVAHLRSLLTVAGLMLPAHLYEAATLKLGISASTNESNTIYAPHGYLEGLAYCSRLTSLQVDCQNSNSEALSKLSEALQVLPALSALHVQYAKSITWLAPLTQLTALRADQFRGPSNPEFLSALTRLVDLRLASAVQMKDLECISPLTLLTCLEAGCPSSFVTSNAIVPLNRLLRLKNISVNVAGQAAATYEEILKLIGAARNVVAWNY